jgi:Acyl-protein synthetase, LuxE
VKSNLFSFSAHLRELIEAAPERLSQEDQFNAEAKELFALQFESNLPYRRYCEFVGVSPHAIESWRQIPALPTTAFKEYEVTSIPEADRQLFFQSSGTTSGNRGRHYHFQQSLRLYECSLLAWFRTRVLANADRRFRILSLTPPLEIAPNSSLVHMFETIGREHGSPQNLFAGTLAADGGWQVDCGAAAKFIDASRARSEAVLMVGTAFNYVHFIDALAERNINVKLPPGSRVLETGGYKGRSRAIPRSQLHSDLSRAFGVESSQIITEYGMSELSSQAYSIPHEADAPSLFFEFPPWARVQVISPETGRRAGEGCSGLIRVVDLANVWSAMAIQTEDLGIDHGGQFEMSGRASAAEPRGCSLLPS